MPKRISYDDEPQPKFETKTITKRKPRGKPMSDEKADEYFESNIYPGILSNIAEGVERSTKEGIERQKRIALLQAENNRLAKAAVAAEEAKEKTKKIDTKITDAQIKKAKKLYADAKSGKVDIDTALLKEVKEMINKKFSIEQLSADKSKAAALMLETEQAIKHT